MVVVVLWLGSAAAFAQQNAPQKKAITHDVYDSWKSIQGTKLSADGAWLAYALTPQDGDGELVVRNVKRNAEIRAVRGRDPIITSDGRFVAFARRGYFNMMSRGYPSASSRPQLGQRALELPTILVTNQHSLSDAEDFTEGYRTLKLGKVVGEPTAGWIIYTGSITLIDGSVLRMPGSKIFASGGTPMEMHLRPVDVPVTRPVGESYSGKDVQLDAAVAELLKRLGNVKRTDSAVPAR